MPESGENVRERTKPKQEQPPPVFYRYLSVDTAGLVLSNRTLRFSSPLQFNDPFDTQWNPVWPLQTKEMRLYAAWLVVQFWNDRHIWPGGMLKQDSKTIHVLDGEAIPPAIEKWAEESSISQDTLQQIQGRFNELCRRARVLCLTETDESVLMWSHYGGQHRGCVLGFDSHRMESGLKHRAASVAYSTTLPELLDFKAYLTAHLNGRNPPDVTGRAKEWALTKHSGWQYEKEWRYVWVAAAGSSEEYEDVPIPDKALVELVLGCRTSDEYASQWCTLARTINPEVRLYRMDKHPTNFALVKREIGGLHEP